MTDKYTIGVDVTMNTKQQTSSGKVKSPSSAPQTQPDSPFCIAILGDFSGRIENEKSIAERRLIEIDRDNFEQVMADLNILLTLQMDNQQSIEIRLSELDDFHPDELYDRLESFSQLRSLKRRLNNNKTFDQAAAEIQGWGVDVQQQTDVTEPPVKTEVDMPEGNLLDNILESQQTGKNEATSEAGQIDRLIKSIVAPYVEPAEDPRKDDLIAIVDTATEAHMRSIMHHPQFQQIEAAWLSLYRLVRELETGAKLKLYLLDINRHDMVDDLSVDNIQQSALYKKFCDTAEGDLPWSVLLGNYQFADSIEDILTLGSLGEIAQQANAVFIGGVHERMAGCESFAQSVDYEDWNYQRTEGVDKAWSMLRQSAAARHIGLALPRFLLRQPYGRKGKQLESFAFEEIDVADSVEQNHAAYLWGNAAFIKVELLAKSFLKSGWNMMPGEVHQVEKLPLHYYEDEGEAQVKAVAEIYLTEKGAEKMTGQGLMPLFSVKNMDAIRSADFSSVSEREEKIQGRWVENVS